MEIYKRSGLVYFGSIIAKSTEQPGTNEKPHQKIDNQTQHNFLLFLPTHVAAQL